MRHRPKRTAMRLALIPALAAVVLLGCGASNATTNSNSAVVKPVSPSRFQDDYDAHLATNNKELFLAVTGKDKRGNVGSQVLRLVGSRWEQVGQARTATTSTAVSIAAANSVSRQGFEICNGFSVLDKRAESGVSPLVRCLKNGRWRHLRAAKTLRSLYLQGIDFDNGSFVGLFSAVKGKRSVVRMGRIAHSRVVPMGRPLNLDGQYTANFGEKTEKTDNSGFDVAVRDGNGTRFVATLKNGSWDRSARVPNVTLGPQLSGSVRNAKQLFLPVTEVVKEGPDVYDWPLSIYATLGESWTELGGQPVNVGEGSAQGSLNAVGNEIWASWVQNALNPKGFFDTTNFVAQVDPKTMTIGEPELLWSGKAYAPGKTQVLRYKGTPTFMYFRQFAGKRGLHVTIEGEDAR